MLLPAFASFLLRYTLYTRCVTDAPDFYGIKFHHYLYCALHLHPFILPLSNTHRDSYPHVTLLALHYRMIDMQLLSPQQALEHNKAPIAQWSERLNNNMASIRGRPPRVVYG